MLSKNTVENDLKIINSISKEIKQENIRDILQRSGGLAALSRCWHANTLLTCTVEDIEKEPYYYVT